MKSSKIVDQINNRIFIILPLILISGFLSFMFLICNISLIMSGGNIYDLISGDVIPLKIGLSIPIFSIALIYYLKLSSILNRIEERSWHCQLLFYVNSWFYYKKIV